MNVSRLPLPDDHVCIVCGVETTGGTNYHRSSVPTCDACKVFFWRNRNKLDCLKCLTGRNNCAIVGGESKARRAICPRCRLVKCSNVGMVSRQRGDKNDKDKNNNSTSTAIIRLSDSNKLRLPKVATLILPPEMAENRIAETVLKLAVRACADLSPLQSLPWTTGCLNVINDVQMWSYSMANFQYAITVGLNYVKDLAEMAPLTLADKCHLLAGSFTPNLIAQIALSATSGYTLFGMNPTTKAIFLRFYPIFEPLATDIDEIASLFNIWHPSLAEFALLEALLFFRVDTLNQLEQPQIVIEANRRLSAALNLLAGQSRYPDLQLHLFRRVYDKLQAANTRHDQICVELAHRRCDLIHIGKLFADMFSMSTNDRKQRANLLLLNFSSALESNRP